MRFTFDNEEILSCLHTACKAVRNLHKLGYVHRNIQPNTFTVCNDDNGPLILHSFYYAVADTNIDYLHDLPENKYYYMEKQEKAGS